MKKISFIRFIVVTAAILELIFLSPMICKLLFGFGFMYSKYLLFGTSILTMFGTMQLTEYYYDEPRRINSDEQFIIKQLKKLSKKYPELNYTYYRDKWDNHIIIFKDPLLCSDLINTLRSKFNKKLYGVSAVLGEGNYNKTYYQLIYES